MSSQSRPSTSSRPPDGNSASVIGQGMSASQFPRRDHARRINIPERRLWSHDRPRFYIQDSSSSSQDGSSTKSSASGGSSTTSEGREGLPVHTVSPYGSFFVGDMDFDSPSESNSHSRGGGDWTRGTTADINRVLFQASTRRPPSSQNGLYRRQPPTAPSLFVTAESATYVGMPGALPVPGRNAPNEWDGTSSTLTAGTHRSQSNHLTSWNRGHRNGSNNLHNQAHNSQVRQSQVTTGTALPPGSSLGSSPSNPDRQRTRGVTRTTWRN
jgi:hypothetical protein